MDIPVRRAFDPWFGVDTDTFDRPSRQRLIDQHFGLGLQEDEFFVQPSSFMYQRYPFRHQQRLLKPHSSDSGLSEMKVGKDTFSVKLDVHQFTPAEVVVKTRENSLIIEAKHEEKEDPHGFVYRHFVRRYPLPEDVRPENLICNLSSDGVLAIEAPRVPIQQEGDNVIPINQTGRPAVVMTKPKNIDIEKEVEVETPKSPVDK